MSMMKQSICVSTIILVITKSVVLRIIQRETSPKLNQVDTHTDISILPHLKVSPENSLNSTLLAEILAIGSHKMYANNNNAESEILSTETNSWWSTTDYPYAKG